MVFKPLTVGNLLVLPIGMTLGALMIVIFAITLITHVSYYNIREKLIPKTSSL